MLDEVQHASWLQDAAHLGDGGHRIRDGAEAPGAENGVGRVVRQWQALAVETDHLDRNAGCCDAVTRQLDGPAGRLDGAHAGDARWHERQVVAGAETDLDDVAGQARAHPRPYLSRLLRVHHDIDQVRQHAL